MHASVFFNGKFHSPAEINLPVVSNAAFYGKGIFTTVAIYHGKPFLWERHWRRLSGNAEKIKLNLSEFTEKKVISSLFDLIDQNKIENARARITFFDESTGGAWRTETNRKTSFLITSADFRTIKDEFYLTVSPYRINSKSPLAGVKSCNYLENVLALEKADDEFDEAVRLNEKGAVASACLANIFWIKNEKIFTPALETGCLAGTTRDFIIETAEQNGFEVLEVSATIEKLLEADEVFLTSAGIGVRNVKKIDKKSFGDRITAQFNRLYAEKTDYNSR